MKWAAVRCSDRRSAREQGWRDFHYVSGRLRPAEARSCAYRQVALSGMSFTLARAVPIPCFLGETRGTYPGGDLKFQVHETLIALDTSLLIAGFLHKEMNDVQTFH